MVDHCDLNLLVDNRYPTINLDVIGANGECGVVPCANRGSLTLNVFANQIHGRLFYWNLSYVKGLMQHQARWAVQSITRGYRPCRLT